MYWSPSPATIGVEGHPDRLQRAGAEAADRDRGDVMVDARQQLRVAADVVALLAQREAAAHEDVRGLREVDLGVALDQRLERDGGEVVGADVLQRALAGTPDRRADRVDDDGVGHWSSPLVRASGAKATAIGERLAPAAASASVPASCCSSPSASTTSSCGSTSRR